MNKLFKIEHNFCVLVMSSVHSYFLVNGINGVFQAISSGNFVHGCMNMLLVVFVLSDIEQTYFEEV